MFSFDGYTSLATLWREFTDKFAEDLVQEARRIPIVAPDSDDETPLVRIPDGSPADFVEQLFLETLDEYTLSFLRMKEDPVDVLASDKHGHSRRLERLSAVEAFSASIEAESEPEMGGWLLRLGTDRFEPVPNGLSDPALWTKIYVDGQHGVSEFADLPFHTVPFLFSRHSFVVPQQLPPWADDAIDATFLEAGFPGLLGSSICLVDDAALQWRSIVLTSAWLREQVGEEFLRRRIGRPEKQTAAREAYELLFPDGHKGSWKQAAAEVERATGVPISVKTLQRAVESEGNLDKS